MVAAAAEGLGDGLVARKTREPQVPTLQVPTLQVPKPQISRGKGSFPGQPCLFQHAPAVRVKLPTLDIPIVANPMCPTNRVNIGHWQSACQ